jgi:hypothetical protein
MIDVVARLDAISAWSKSGNGHANVGDKSYVLDYLWVSTMVLRKDAKCHTFRTRCGTWSLASSRVGEDARRCEELDDYLRAVGHVSEHLSRAELVQRVERIPAAFRADTDNLVRAMQALSKLCYTNAEDAQKRAEDHICAVLAYNQHLGCLGLISAPRLRKCVCGLTDHDRVLLTEAIRHITPPESVTKAHRFLWWGGDTTVADLLSRIERVNTRLGTERSGRLLLTHLPSACAFSPVLIDEVAKQYPEATDVHGDLIGSRTASASVLSALMCALIAGETMVSAWQRLSTEAGGEYSLLS